MSRYQRDGQEAGDVLGSSLRGIVQGISILTFGRLARNAQNKQHLQYVLIISLPKGNKLDRMCLSLRIVMSVDSMFASRDGDLFKAV